MAIFLDGCFWHGCPQHYIGPRTRGDFWSRKLRENVERDASVDAQLRAAGFRVVHLWQHELGSPDRVAERVCAALNETAHATSPSFVVGRVWWTCACGADDVQVSALSGPGSLKPAGKVRPALASLVCRNCGAAWNAAVPTEMQGEAA